MYGGREPDRSGVKNVWLRGPGDLGQRGPTEHPRVHVAPPRTLAAMGVNAQLDVIVAGI